MPPDTPLPKAQPKTFATASSGWKHLTGVLANTAARNLYSSQQSRKGIRQMINKGH